MYRWLLQTQGEVAHVDSCAKLDVRIKIYLACTTTKTVFCLLVFFLEQPFHQNRTEFHVRSVCVSFYRVHPSVPLSQECLKSCRDGSVVSSFSLTTAITVTLKASCRKIFCGKHSQHTFFKPSVICVKETCEIVTQNVVPFCCNDHSNSQLQLTSNGVDNSHPVSCWDFMKKTPTFEWSSQAQTHRKVQGTIPTETFRTRTEHKIKSKQNGTQCKVAPVVCGCSVVLSFPALSERTKTARNMLSNLAEAKSRKRSSLYKRGFQTAHPPLRLFIAFRLGDTEVKSAQWKTANTQQQTSWTNATRSFSAFQARQFFHGCGFSLLTTNNFCLVFACGHSHSLPFL